MMIRALTSHKDGKLAMGENNTSCRVLRFV